MNVAQLHEEGCITDPKKALHFLLAGNAYLTLVSKKTGVRYTFRVSLAKEDVQANQQNLFHNRVPTKQKPKTWFVSLLSGQDNTSDYVYLGIVQSNIFRLTKKSRMNSESAPVKAFGWTFAKLQQGVFPDELEFWHMGRCGRCGRMLTVPSSIAAGIGPECAGKGAL